MRLTPDLLRASYALLAETAPFDKWALPDVDDVEFSTLKTSRLFGDIHRRAGRYSIRLSEARHTRLTGVLATMAHEMTHLHLDETGCEKDSTRHGPAFRAYAVQVCAAHPEFDPTTF